MKEVIYYGTKYGHISKITTKYRKKHLLKDRYSTRCGRKIIKEYPSGKKSWKYEWRNKTKEEWRDTELTECKLCFEEKELII